MSMVLSKLDSNPYISRLDTSRKQVINQPTN